MFTSPFWPCRPWSREHTGERSEGHLMETTSLCREAMVPLSKSHCPYRLCSRNLTTIQFTNEYLTKDLMSHKIVPFDHVGINLNTDRDRYTNMIDWFSNNWMYAIKALHYCFSSLHYYIYINEMGKNTLIMITFDDQFHRSMQLDFHIYRIASDSSQCFDSFYTLNSQYEYSACSYAFKSKWVSDL